MKINRAFLAEITKAGLFFAGISAALIAVTWLLIGEEYARNMTSGLLFAMPVCWLFFVVVWGATREDAMDLARREADMKRRMKERGLR